MIITRTLDGIFDSALENELCKPIWADDDIGDIAMAFMNGDDPWILRYSPLPSPNTFEWPNQEEVNKWLDTKIDNASVLDRLKLLAKGGDLESDQRVLGSCLKIYTSTYDFEIRYWLEARLSDRIFPRRSPLCPSGRTFQFSLPKRFEPQEPYRAPLAFFSRSFLCLSFSTMEVVPSRILQNYLKWYVQPQDPLIWNRAGRSVARYEVYHGPLDYNWSRRNMRQPTLSRWIVRSDELKTLGDLNPCWDYETHQFLTS